MLNHRVILNTCVELAYVLHALDARSCQSKRVPTKKNCAREGRSRSPNGDNRRPARFGRAGGGDAPEMLLLELLGVKHGLLLSLQLLLMCQHRLLLCRMLLLMGLLRTFLVLLLPLIQ